MSDKNTFILSLTFTDIVVFVWCSLFRCVDLSHCIMSSHFNLKIFLLCFLYHRSASNGFSGFVYLGLPFFFFNDMVSSLCCPDWHQVFLLTWLSKDLGTIVLPVCLIIWGCLNLFFIFEEEWEIPDRRRFYSDKSKGKRGAKENPNLVSWRTLLNCKVVYWGLIASVKGLEQWIDLDLQP